MCDAGSRRATWPGAQAGIGLAETAGESPELEDRPREAPDGRKPNRRDVERWSFDRLRGRFRLRKPNQNSEAAAGLPSPIARRDAGASKWCVRLGGVRGEAVSQTSKPVTRLGTGARRQRPGGMGSQFREGRPLDACGLGELGRGGSGTTGGRRPLTAPRFGRSDRSNSRTAALRHVRDDVGRMAPRPCRGPRFAGEPGTAPRGTGAPPPSPAGASTRSYAPYPCSTPRACLSILFAPLGARLSWSACGSCRQPQTSPTARQPDVVRRAASRPPCRPRPWPEGPSMARSGSPKPSWMPLALVSTFGPVLRARRRGGSAPVPGPRLYLPKSKATRRRPQQRLGFPSRLRSLSTGPKRRSADRRNAVLALCARRRAEARAIVSPAAAIASEPSLAVAGCKQTLYRKDHSGVPAIPLPRFPQPLGPARRWTPVPGQ